MTDEIMKDAELEEVVGGSGVECIGLMTRLQQEGLAKFNTPLTQGNEKAAAKELQSYLTGLGIKDFEFQIHSDDTPNSYSLMKCVVDVPGYLVQYEGETISADAVVGLIKKQLGVI